MFICFVQNNSFGLLINVFSMPINQSEQYLKGLLEGNEKVIMLIYKKCYPSVASFVIKNNGNQQDAEEVFHDALYQLTARVKVRNFQIKSTFEGYMFTVCKNLWRKELNSKKKQVRNEGVFELVHEENDHSAFILEQERWDLFEEKIELLSDNCRQLLRDFFNKVTYDEIVKKFNYASSNTAFQRVFKCKKRLMELIKKDSRYKDLS